MHTCNGMKRKRPSWGLEAVRVVALLFACIACATSALAQSIVAGSNPCFPLGADGKYKECTLEQELQAGSEADDGFEDWKSLYKSYVKYHQCVDGWIAESYSIAVGELLAKRWETLHQLNELRSLDPVFGTWVLDCHHHPGFPPGADDAILENASGRCQRGQESLCKRIIKNLSYD